MRPVPQRPARRTGPERGKGSSTASLAAGLLEQGQAYSVSVHGGPAKEDPVVSCGDLRPEQGVPDRRRER